MSFPFYFHGISHNWLASYFVQITPTMSKRQYVSPVPASASHDLIKRLKAAGNDAALLCEIFESNDSGSVAAAFAALLTSEDKKRRNKVSKKALWADGKQ